MSETQMLETIGRKQMQLESLQAQAANLLNVLADVVSGATERSRVMVNLTAGSWIIAEPGQRPAMPFTINGEPRCVVAPGDPVQDGLDAIAAHHAKANKEPGEVEVTLPPG